MERRVFRDGRRAGGYPNTDEWSSEMRHKLRLILVIPAVLLVLCLVGIFLTRGVMANLQFLTSRGRDGSGYIVDQRPLQTAQALFPLAVSAEEQAHAHEAIRIGDHEVDQAFAMALRQANAENRTLTGKAVAVAEKITALQQTVKEDQAAVASLAASAKSRNPGPSDDDLDVAKTQLALDGDELMDAQNNLALVSGDQRGKIQEELATHEAGMKKFDDHTEGGQTAVISSQRYSTLSGRLTAWFNQRNRMSQIEQAKLQADQDAVSLTAEYRRLQQKAATLTGTEKAARPEVGGTAQGLATQGLAEGQRQIPAQRSSQAGLRPPALSAAEPVVKPMTGAAVTPALTPALTPTSRTDRLVLLRRLEAQRNILGILMDRIDGQKELSENYAAWLAQVRLQHRIIVHLMLQSFAWIAFIVLGAVFLAWIVAVLIERRITRRATADARSMHTLQTVLQLIVQFVALLLILLVIFGPPSQVPTILGLATAGLTVVFQDFILAFFGWFVLMGKNGIRVGDWVEINGIGGEVVEIGLFRTALLESGNWTDKGHPTGRRTTFVNKFAVSGQYFNFSTIGQWMWDEIKVNIPTSEDSYDLIERIHQAVLAETAKDTALAQSEWQRATQQHGMSQFSATPSVDMRPAPAGIDIVVRYVTRAGDRFEMRNRLYQAVIGLMREPAPALAAAGK